MIFGKKTGALLHALSMDGPQTSRDLAKKVGIESRAVAAHLSGPAKSGRVIRAGVIDGHGNRLTIWRVPDAGERPAPLPPREQAPPPSFPDPWVLRNYPPAPASLTAAICGDPAPGRSALDQARAQR